MVLEIYLQDQETKRVFLGLQGSMFPNFNPKIIGSVEDGEGSFARMIFMQTKTPNALVELVF